HTGNWSRRAVSAPYQVGALAFDAAGERIYCNDKDRIVRLRAGDAVALDAQVSLKPDNADIEIAADGSLVYFHMAGELLAWRHADRMVAWRRKGLVLAGGGALVEGANLLVCVDEATCEPVLVDPTTGDERRRLAWPEGLEKTGNLMAATDEGSVLAITSEPARDGDSWTELLVWRATEDYQPVRLRPEPLQGVPYKYLMGSPAISPDGKYVACCCWNGYRVVEVATGVASWIKTPHEFMNNAGLRFSPDSKELWAVGMGLHSGIYRMDVAKGELLGVVSFEAATGSEVSGKTFAVEPGGKTVLVAPAVGNSDKTLYRVEIATGKVVDHLKAHTSSLQALQLSPDGRWVATLDSSFVLHVWRMTE
ncbi:MAG: hypothetical protein IT463_11145, partial [Planctomycetes bacterium]|nr:hypothetical protein [Planctomycetota bacterium]